MKWILFCFLLLTGCAGQFGQRDIQPSEEGANSGLTLTIDGTAVDVRWEDNDAVSELIDCVRKAQITVHTSAYGGFEQVGSLPRSFSASDVRMTTVPGDIVLYSGNQLVVFYGSNSWSYTRLGHISLSTEKLTELLGGEGAVIELKYLESTIQMQ